MLCLCIVASPIFQAVKVFEKRRDSAVGHILVFSREGAMGFRSDCQSSGRRVSHGGVSEISAVGTVASPQIVGLSFHAIHLHLNMIAASNDIISGAICSPHHQFLVLSFYHGIANKNLQRSSSIF